MSNIPSHRFKTDNNLYIDGTTILEDEINEYANLANYPPLVWVASDDSQGTYNSPTNTISDESDCAYVIEQQIISFSLDPNKEECYNILSGMYTSAQNNGQSFCSAWSDFLNNYLTSCLDGQILCKSPQKLDKLYP